MKTKKEDEIKFYYELNKLRAFIAFIAETIDVYRIVPRIMVVGYIFLIYKIVDWFMNLGIEATTQQTSFVTVIVSLAAAIFGFYTNSGTKWSEYNFHPWNPKEKSKEIIKKPKPPTREIPEDVNDEFVEDFDEFPEN